MASNGWEQKQPNTPDWALYEAGKQYNMRLSPNYYDTVDANIDFFNGNQWRNLPEANLPKPVFNVIKRVVTFFVASITSNAVKIQYSPMFPDAPSTQPGAMQPSQIVEYLNRQVAGLLEKFKMEYRVRDALRDAAITGDAAAHFYFDMKKRPYGTTGEYSDIKGEICMEIVDGVNIMFGNANNPIVDEQPYIIVAGRDMVKTLQAQAKAYKKMGQKTDDPNTITSDVDYLYQAGWDADIEIRDFDDYGKALYIVVYRKVYDEKTGECKILASKSVQNAYIFRDVDTGLSRYPVAWMNWEKQKNQYHGRAVCTGMLPNQIFINRMFAMIMYHLMMTAFPKAVYNQDYIAEWNSQIGAAIGVSGLGSEISINNLAGYMQASDISPNLFKIIDMAMSYTKEMLGVSDAALGSIDPKNTSATIAVQKATAIPLANPRANLYEFVEDIGGILEDMIGTYYGTRPVVMDDTETDQQTVQMFDFSILKDVSLNTKINVGEATYWSEITNVQTLDNLLASQHIDIIQYLERLPGEYLPQKEKQIDELREAQQMAKQMAQQQAEAQAKADADKAANAEQTPQQPAQPSLEDILSHLSPEERAAFEKAPPDVQKQMLAQLEGAA